jgi:hypothetical protein
MLSKATNHALRPTRALCALDWEILYIPAFITCGCYKYTLQTTLWIDLPDQSMNGW